MNKADINNVCRFLCGHNFSSHLGKYQKVQLLDHMGSVSLLLGKTARLPSRAAVPFRIPTKQWMRAVAPRPCRCLALSAIWILAIAVGVQRYLLVLICSPLMRNDAEHLFIFLFAICISYLMSSLIFCPVLIGLFISHCWVLQVVSVFRKVIFYQISFVNILCVARFIFLMALGTLKCNVPSLKRI